jgi:DNA-binding XRE family transcriptional regulator
VDEIDRAWELRRELGRDLKARRQAAGLSQPQLASRTGYARSTVATLESATGGAVARAFWEKCDAVFSTGERFAPRWDTIQQHVQAARALTAATRRRPGPRRRKPAGATHLQALRTLRSTTADPDGVAQAKTACAQLGWPVAPDTALPELLTGTVVDALQVPRPAGLLAISWWLDTGGTADPVRFLPALPRPDQALAAISASGSVYFLAQAGAFPWSPAGTPPVARCAATDRPPRDATDVAGPVIAWHSHGSRVPLPPGPAAADDPAQ